MSLLELYLNTSMFIINNAVETDIFQVMNRYPCCGLEGIYCKSSCFHVTHSNVTDLNL